VRFDDRAAALRLAGLFSHAGQTVS
jgi:hypothetical protein